MLLSENNTCKHYKIIPTLSENRHIKQTVINLLTGLWQLLKKTEQIPPQCRGQTAILDLGRFKYSTRITFHMVEFEKNVWAVQIH